MLKIGHRGAAGYEPENSLLSFGRAMEFGVDAIELDVQKCKTGELVVIHDDCIDRVSNGIGLVSEKSLIDLKKLDTGKGQTIPTLEEVLDLINKRVPVNIELKGKGTAGLVSFTIDRYINKFNWDKNLFWVSSFDRDELIDFSRISPNISISFLFENITDEDVFLAKSFGANSIGLSLESISQDIVDKIHGYGIAVFVWTVNEQEDIKKMKLIGVDGIFSDFPDRL